LGNQEDIPFYIDENGVKHYIITSVDRPAIIGNYEDIPFYIDENGAKHYIIVSVDRPAINEDQSP